jgi:hypothetical protein
MRCRIFHAAAGFAVHSGERTESTSFSSTESTRSVPSETHEASA